MISTRAKIVTRRTYNRPKDEAGTIFESWDETINRVISHQRWLWERALTHKEYPELKLKDIKEDFKDWVSLNYDQEIELQELKELLLDRKVAVSGRTLWLGGTGISKVREASMFNCAFKKATSVYDVVDAFWLLLQGAGVGSLPVSGILTGFRKHIPALEIIPSKGLTSKGPEHNSETWDPITETWTIKIGDSAEAWAKSIGKLLAGKYPAKKLVLDMSDIRKEGIRLRNYGWISQGDKGLSKAYAKIFTILNRRADALLSSIDILDIYTLLGTVLSTRRAAQICLYDYGQSEWKAFAHVKADMWDNPELSHRSQSNNSLIFWNKPSKSELKNIFNMINKGGNGEPGIINGAAMKQRAPWAFGLNPCAEVLLADGGFCNLVTIDLLKFIDDYIGLHKAAKLIARANYRQTIVDFRDEILQEVWHLNNEFLHLCGVSLMGVVGRPDMKAYDYRRLERTITTAAYGMAKELDKPYPKNVTTMKPEGTISKCYDSTEGMHKPLGKYIFNNIAFSKYDPLIEKLKEAGYKVFNHPYDDAATLITFPVKYDNVEFEEVDGKEVNLESAIDQLERYKMLMTNYCHQNVSCTISYDVSETDEIVNWIYSNWDDYVAVSFLFRNDPTKTAKDLGYPYLPQEVVSKEEYEEYMSKLREVDLESANSSEELLEDGCAGGVCPVR